MNFAASSTRSRTSSGVSTRGLIGSVTPTKMLRSPVGCFRRIARTRGRSVSLAHAVLQTHDGVQERRRRVELDGEAAFREIDLQRGAPVQALADVGLRL